MRLQRTRGVLPSSSVQHVALRQATLRLEPRYPVAAQVRPTAQFGVKVKRTWIKSAVPEPRSERSDTPDS
jgi:hypothetical protein